MDAAESHDGTNSAFGDICIQPMNPFRDYTCVSRERRESVRSDIKPICLQLQKEETWKGTWKTSLWRSWGKLILFREKEKRIDRKIIVCWYGKFSGRLNTKHFHFSSDRHKHIYCLRSCFSGRLGFPYVPSNRQFSSMAFIFLFYHLNFLSGLAC